MSRHLLPFIDSYQFGQIYEKLWTISRNLCEKRWIVVVVNQVNCWKSQRKHFLAFDWLIDCWCSCCLVSSLPHHIFLFYSSIDSFLFTRVLRVFDHYCLVSFIFLFPFSPRFMFYVLLCSFFDQKGKGKGKGKRKSKGSNYHGKPLRAIICLIDLHNDRKWSRH